MTIGYHFVGKTLRDGSPVPKEGVWLHHKGPIHICESGLHYSLTPFDALQYAPGAILCQVEIKGIAETERDKGVARSRKIIQRFDATEMLRWFARQQALSVIHLWDKCPPDVVLDYLMTGDESLRDAAGAAAWDAAWGAASAAARAAAREAALAEAAWGAASAAARAAAWDAAWEAAWDAARAAARAAAWDAAWDAAWGAAWEAAWAESGKQFNDLVYAEFGVRKARKA